MLYYFVCAYCGCGYVHATTCMLRSENNFVEQVVSLHLYVDSRNQTQPILYLLSTFQCPFALFCEGESHVAQTDLKFYVTKDGLELLVFLPPPPRFWGYRCASPLPAAISAFCNLHRREGTLGATVFCDLPFLPGIWAWPFLIPILWLRTVTQGFHIICFRAWDPCCRGSQECPFLRNGAALL